MSTRHSVSRSYLGVVWQEWGERLGFRRMSIFTVSHAPQSHWRSFTSDLFLCSLTCPSLHEPAIDVDGPEYLLSHLRFFVSICEALVILQTNLIKNCLLQRSMDSVGGPDAKKARWSPTSFSNGMNGLSNGNATRDAFANYGYGPQASIAQSGFNNSPPSNGFAGNPLYTTPSLSINTTTGATSIASQMSPNTAGPYTPQTTQTPTSANGTAYGNFGGYNMLSMGIPNMSVLNGFAYANQMNSFAQVGTIVLFLAHFKTHRCRTWRNSALLSLNHRHLHTRLLLFLSPVCP